jgi:GT2 family glycosyltransferase
METFDKAMPKLHYPKVSVIILNWNGLLNTLECLESLKKITYQNYDIILIDNGSEGNDVRILKEKFGDCIRLIENNLNSGFTEGNNIGIRLAIKETSPDYILLLNNDTVVAVDFLDQLVAVAEKNPLIGIVGPKIYFYNQPEKIQFTMAKIDLWRGKVIQIGYNEIDRGQYDTLQEIESCEGSCFLIRREVMEKIGGLDSEYFAYWEDTDYCLRARKAGFRIVYCPLSKIWHKGWSKIWDKTYICIAREVAVYYFERNRFLFIKKHANRLQKVSFLLYYIFFQFWFWSGYFLIYYRNLQGYKAFLRGFYAGMKLFFEK